MPSCHNLGCFSLSLIKKIFLLIFCHQEKVKVLRTEKHLKKNCSQSFKFNSLCFNFFIHRELQHPTYQEYQRKLQNKQLTETVRGARKTMSPVLKSLVSFPDHHAASYSYSLESNFCMLNCYYYWDKQLWWLGNIQNFAFCISAIQVQTSVFIQSNLS